MKSLFTGIFLLLLLTGCKKNGTKKIDAGKITTTDLFGQSTGATDPSDWRFDDKWSAEEQALFNFADTASLVGTKQAATTRSAGYPNPASERIAFSFTADQPSLLKVVITDEQLNILYKSASPINATSSSNFMLDLTSGQYKKGSYYRIYYTLYAEGAMMYKRGHGDFQRL
jgi:hypothetical protein